MCMGLASGYREPVRKSLLKEDPTEKFKETVCDDICKHKQFAIYTKETIEEECENCILNRVKKVELEG